MKKVKIPILVPRATSTYRGQEGSSPEGFPLRSNLTSPTTVCPGPRISIFYSL